MCVFTKKVIHYKPKCPVKYLMKKKIILQHGNIQLKTNVFNEKRAPQKFAANEETEAMHCLTPRFKFCDY